MHRIRGGVVLVLRPGRVVGAGTLGLPAQAVHYQSGGRSRICPRRFPSIPQYARDVQCALQRAVRGGGVEAGNEVPPVGEAGGHDVRRDGR